MTSEDVQTNLRLPAELKERVLNAASQNKRSLSAEVAARLESSFDASLVAGSLPLLVEEHVSELVRENKLSRADALEAMAVRSQDAQGPVVIIHYTQGMKIADLRALLNQLGDSTPPQASVLVYPG